MAYLPIQRGELTDRIRRWFGITGTYKGHIDETVAPVVVVQQLEVPPYSVSVRNWKGVHSSVQGALGSPAFMVVRNSPRSGQVIVVDSVRYLSQAGTVPNWLNVYLGASQPGTIGPVVYAVDVAGSTSPNSDPLLHLDPLDTLPQLVKGATADVNLRGKLIDVVPVTDGKAEFTGPVVLGEDQALTVSPNIDEVGAGFSVFAAGRVVDDAALAKLINGTG